MRADREPQLLDVLGELASLRVHVTVAVGNLRQDEDDGQAEARQLPHELLLPLLEPPIGPPHEIPGRVDLLVDRLHSVLRHERAQPRHDGVARGSRLEALGVVQPEEPIRVPVVHQPLGDGATDARARDITTEDRVDESRLADTRLAEHGEVEAPQSRERLGQSILEHPLDLGTREVRGPRDCGDRIRGSGVHVRHATRAQRVGQSRPTPGYRGRVSTSGRGHDYRARYRRRRRWSALIAGIVVVALVGTALAGAWSAFLGTTQGQRITGSPIVVPEHLREVILEASERCEAIPVEVFAAQIAAESHWDARAVSPAGARGIAQFMPEVWKQYGVDADGDGRAEVWNPVDAIHSAAELNCVNRRLVRDVPGNRLLNTLAAYNAGFGNVLKYEGIPPFPETEAYLERIMRYAETISWGAPTAAVTA